MTNLTYFKALIIGRQKVRSVGVYHFFLLHNSMKPSASWHFWKHANFLWITKLSRTSFLEKLKRKKNYYYTYMELSTHFNVKNVWHVNKNFACTWVVVVEVTNLYVPQVRKVVRQDNLSPLSFWRVRYFSKRGVSSYVLAYFSFAIWCSSSILLLDHFLA